MPDATSQNDEYTRIICADCVDVAEFVQPPVHLIVTSPPYNLGKDYGTADDQITYEKYLTDVSRWGRAWQTVLVEGSRVAINIPLDTNGERTGRGKGSRKLTTQKRFMLADYHRVFADLGYIYNTTILWDEENVSRRTAWGSWMSASDPWITTPTEAILVYSWKSRKRPDAKGKKTGIWRDEFLKWSLGRWRFGGQAPSRAGGHPAAFPPELPNRLIKLYSFMGDRVLDPFNGSGTTTTEARLLGRYGIGFDLEEKYCRYAWKCAASVKFEAGLLPDPYTAVDPGDQPLAAGDQLRLLG